jgi:tetratricopeptide (TPR) repeat protein
MTHQPESSPHLGLAKLLLAQGRHADAIGCLHKALEASPNDPAILGRLSLSLHCVGRMDEALETIDLALTHSPELAELYAQRGLILSDLEEFQEAHKACAQAVILDPGHPLGHAARSELLAAEYRWGEAESAAREALQRDPEYLLAQNVLSQALLMQDKRDENEADLSARLERDPENAYTHCNVGRAALRRGNYLEAQEHFRESLRLEPSIEEARQGLLDAFRSRSPLYRAFLRFSFFIAKFSRTGRLWFALGVLLGYQLLFHGIFAPWPMLAVGIALIYLVLVLWSFVGPGLGTLIVLTDRIAYNALTSSELREGIIGGGAFVLGTATIATAAVLGRIDLGLCGLALAASSLPLSVIFRNSHPQGRCLYAGIAAIAIVCVGVMAADVLRPGSFPILSSWALICAASAVAVTTWLVNLGIWFDSH